MPITIRRKFKQVSGSVSKRLSAVTPEDGRPITLEVRLPNELMMWMMEGEEVFRLSVRVLSDNLPEGVQVSYPTGAKQPAVKQ